jgi:hypothetical protein
MTRRAGDSRWTEKDSRPYRRQFTEQEGADPISSFARDTLIGATNGYQVEDKVKRDRIY